MTEETGPKGFEVTSIAAVAAVPNEGTVTILFNTKEDGQLGAIIPAALVGTMIATIAAEYQKLAVKRGDKDAVLMPMDLTGIRPFEAARSGEPALLLQLDHVFELALLPTREVVQQMETVAKILRAPPKAERPKLQ